MKSAVEPRLRWALRIVASGGWWFGVAATSALLLGSLVGYREVLEDALIERSSGERRLAIARDAERLRVGDIREWRSLAAETEQVDRQIASIFAREPGAGAADSGRGEDGTIDRIAALATEYELRSVRVRRIDQAMVIGIAREVEFEIVAEGRFTDVMSFLADMAAAPGVLSIISYTIQSRDLVLRLDLRLARLELRDTITQSGASS